MIAGMPTFVPLTMVATVYHGRKEPRIHTKTEGGRWKPQMNTEKNGWKGAHAKAARRKGAREDAGKGD